MPPAQLLGDTKHPKKKPPDKSLQSSAPAPTTHTHLADSKMPSSAPEPTHPPSAYTKKKLSPIPTILRKRLELSAPSIIKKNVSDIHEPSAITAIIICHDCHALFNVYVKSPKCLIGPEPI